LFLGKLKLKYMKESIVIKKDGVKVSDDAFLAPSFLIL